MLWGLCQAVALKQECLGITEMERPPLEQSVKRRGHCINCPLCLLRGVEIWLDIKLAHRGVANTTVSCHRFSHAVVHKERTLCITADPQQVI
eukprot:5257365-Amphidinium_carterae.2